MSDSMEEASALADKVAIIATRLLGTPAFAPVIVAELIDNSLSFF